MTTILKTCTEFINLAPNTGRFYVTALRRLSQNEKAVGKLEAYFDACVDDKGFFNMSKFHSVSIPPMLMWHIAANNSATWYIQYS